MMRVSNSYKYHLFYKTQFAEMLEDFPNPARSADGDWAIGDKSDSDMCSWVDQFSPPQYMLDLVPSLATSCCINQTQARSIVSSDNWRGLI